MRRALLLGLLTLSNASGAQDLPDAPTGAFVYDGANLLSPKDEEAITKIAETFLKDAGGPLMVATVPTIHGGAEGYGKALLEHWKMEKGGLLLLIVKQKGAARVEIAPEWMGDFAGPVREVVKNDIDPAMRRRDYRAALIDGVAGLAYLGRGTGYTQEGPSGPPVAARSTVGFGTKEREKEPAPPDAGRALWIVAAVLGALTAVALAWSRRKPT